MKRLTGEVPDLGGASPVSFWLFVFICPLQTNSSKPA